MPEPILGAMMEAMAAGFGIAVAVVCLGMLALRWYRIRHEFLLMKLAIEKGTMQFPPTQPHWLVSLRQGAMILTLGVSFAIVGGAGLWMAHGVPAPSTTISVVEPPPAPPPGVGEDHPRPPPPHPPDPAREAWDRAKRQEAICLSIIGAGVILILLGGVRLTFVPMERRYLQ